MTVQSDRPDRKPFEQYRQNALDIGADTEAAILLWHIAGCVESDGNRRTARNLYEQAISTLQKDPDPYSQMMAGTAMTDISQIYLNWGLCEDAIPWCDRAIDLASKPAREGDIGAGLILFRALLGKGTAYNALERHDKARAEWERHSPGLTNLEWPPSQVWHLR
jgi:tetratricopeptide (TPR) repeat protein